MLRASVAIRSCEEVQHSNSFLFSGFRLLYELCGLPAFCCGKRMAHRCHQIRYNGFGTFPSCFQTGRRWVSMLWPLLRQGGGEELVPH